VRNKNQKIAPTPNVILFFNESKSRDPMRAVARKDEGAPRRQFLHACERQQAATTTTTV
jgi:hypothetical protein